MCRSSFPGGSKALLSVVTPIFRAVEPASSCTTVAGKDDVSRLATGGPRAVELFAPSPPLTGLLRRCSARRPARGGSRRFVAAKDPEAIEFCACASASRDWHTRWNTLSHGERKRCADRRRSLVESRSAGARRSRRTTSTAAARAMPRRELKSFKRRRAARQATTAKCSRACSQCLFVHPPRPSVRPAASRRHGSRTAIEQASAAKFGPTSRRSLACAVKARRRSACRRTNKAALSKSPCTSKPNKNDHDGKAKASSRR